MAIKFANGKHLAAPDSAVLTFPNGVWSVAFAMQVVDTTTASAAEYIFSNAPYGDVNSCSIVISPVFSPAWSVGAFLQTASSGQEIKTTLAQTSGWMMYVFSRNAANNVYVRSCPLLSSAPADGSSVVTYNNRGVANALNGSGFVIGNRQDLPAGRNCNQALTRMFRADVDLTDLQVARLAYGEQITDLGVTPVWYVRMTDASDYTDQMGAITITPVGSPTTATEPTWGYAGSNSAPVITGTPAISGTPTVGVSTAFTPASVTGTPTPTRTYQWTLDGSDIGGATSATYTPIAGDVGKALRIRQIETNTEGTVNATSSPVTVVSAASLVTATDQTVRRGYQRQSGVAAVPFSGAYTGEVPASIEVQLYASDGTTVLNAWAALTGATISGGSWSGSRSCPAGGMYRFATRSKNSGGTVLATSSVSTNLWGVGDLIVCMGSSSSEKWCNEYSGFPSTALAQVNRYSIYDSWDVGGTSGAIITLGNAYSVDVGVPVWIVESGYGGSYITEWLSTSYAAWTAFQADMAAVGGKVAAVLITVGSNDAGSGTITSKASHLSNYRTLISRIRTETGQPNLPVVVSGSSRRPGDTHDTHFTWAREAEKDLGTDANCYYVQTADLEVSVDNVHLSVAGYQANVARLQRTLIDVFGSGTYHRGPRIVSMVAAGSAATVTLEHVAGTDFTPTSDITGFTASDGSGALTISSAVRSSATAITLTFSRAVVAPVVIQYLYGSSPITTAGGVRDNTAATLPLDIETEMPVTVATKTATIRLIDEDTGTPLATLTGIKWAWYDSSTPDGHAAPTDKGTGETTDASGYLQVAINSSTLSSGGIGSLEISTSDGTTTQSPSPRGWAGPVVVD